jgi:hypothetical protein
MRIAFLLYDQLTQLDMTGPAQVLSRMPGASVDYVAKTMDQVMSDCRLALMPTLTLAESGQFDLLCVPGGYGCSAVMNDEETLGWLRAQAAELLELLGHVDPPARAPGTAWRAWAAAAAEAERSAVVGERSAVVGERSAAVGERIDSVHAAADAAWDQGAIAPSAPEAAAAVSLNHLAISNRITRVVLGSASKLKGVAMVDRKSVV